MAKEVEKFQYQYLNSGTFAFTNEWLYNGMTLDNFRDIFERVTQKELITDILVPDEALIKARYHGADYVQQIYHSHLNLWLHYNMGQVYLHLEKKHSVDSSTLENLDRKEAAKLIKAADRNFQMKYLEFEKSFL